MTERVRTILQRRGATEPVKPFRITRDQAENAWSWVRKRAGFDEDREFVMHALRHTTATRLLDRGIDLYTVKEWLGHSTIQVTERYAHLKPDKLIHAANVLEL